MLRVEELRLAYSAMEVLHGISFELGEGEGMAVLGANGAGKTSLLKALAGVVRPSGRIWLDGVDVTGKDTTDLVRMGVVLVPEGRALFPSLTVRENLVMGGAVHPRKRVEKVMADVLDQVPMIAPWMAMQASRLSGGQQQLVAIARGLMASPRLLLLDEPSLGLAPIMVSHVYGVLAAVFSTGTATVLAEQNVTAALGIVNRAMVLENGRVATVESAAALRHSEEITRSFLGGRREKTAARGQAK
jgi:branched-chain amino acid transport system ATP-binding protein